MKRSKASPKEQKVLEFPYISQHVDVGGQGYFHSGDGQVWPVGVGKAALENLGHQVLSEGLHGAQQGVGWTKAVLPFIQEPTLGLEERTGRPLQPFHLYPPQMLQVECGSHPFLKSPGSSPACQGTEKVPRTKTSMNRHEKEDTNIELALWAKAG